MELKIQKPISKLRFDSSNHILEIIKIILEEIISESLNAAIFFDESSSKELTEIPRENFEKIGISSI